MSTRKRGKLAVKIGREAQVPRVRNPVDPRPGRINTNAASRLLRWSKTVQLVLLSGALHHGLNPKPAVSEVRSKVAFTAWLQPRLLRAGVVFHLKNQRPIQIGIRSGYVANDARGR